ncbi:hypothetical protein [Novosphingobium sp.]|uniref:hypothetical protein n=1 Tax=Novosphingobium sp. TaxID=1874826 RepID=UPI0035B11C07
MTASRMRRAGQGLLAMGLALALAGCNLLGGGGEPDRLAKWVLPNAVLLGDATADPAAGNQIQQSPDGRGYLIVPPPGSKDVPSRIYFVPLAKIDPEIDSAVRKAVFPGGVATIRTGRNIGDMADSGTLEKLAETELDALYLGFTIVDQSALCEGLSKPCDGVGRIILLGKLKGRSLLGQDSQVLMLDAMTSAALTIFDKIGDKAVERCGFDPEGEALPRHIAGACRTMLKLEWAKDNDFTLDSIGSALPLSPEALKVLLAQLAKTSFYEKGALQGRLEKVQ